MENQSEKVSRPSEVVSNVSRRDAIRSLVGGGILAGIGKAVDNVLIGYGSVVGTNLVSQASEGKLATIAREGLTPQSHTFKLGSHNIRIQPGREQITLHMAEDTTVIPLTPAGINTAEEINTDPEAGDVIEQLVSDLVAIKNNEFTFEFHTVDDFFERLNSTVSRPFTAQILRGWPAAEADLVSRFVEVDPSKPRAILEGLTEEFREHAYYDVPRYLAGSIENNVVFGAIDLRAIFRRRTGFSELLKDGSSGLFCYEFTHRSIAALHAVPAYEQTVPVIGARVWDKRHKHVYTAVASIILDDGLRIPITFVDYTHSTLNDDLHLRGILGEGFEAYNKRHRATEIHWQG